MGQMLFLALTGLLLEVSAAGVVAAQKTGPSGGTGWNPVNRLLEKLVNKLLAPLEWQVSKLTDLITHLFRGYPDVTQPVVLELHSQVFRVTLVLAAAAILWIGVLHMLNRVDGIRPVGYIIAAVAFGAVAPSLLYYPVELSRLTTEALVPTNPGFLAFTQFRWELILIALADASILLGIAFLFIARNFYLLLGVVLSPLLALLMVTPSLRRFATLLVNIWVACLLIGPLNAVTLSLILKLLSYQQGPIPQYLWAFAGLMMLLGLPLAVLGAGTLMVSPVFGMLSYTGGAVRSSALKIGRRLWNQSRGDSGESGRRDRRRNRPRPRRKNRFRGDD